MSIVESYPPASNTMSGENPSLMILSIYCMFSWTIHSITKLAYLRIKAEISVDFSMPFGISTIAFSFYFFSGSVFFFLQQQQQQLPIFQDIFLNFKGGRRYFVDFCVWRTNNKTPKTSLDQYFLVKLNFLVYQE